jgi:CheY-like chemotaxis protein
MQTMKEIVNWLRSVEELARDVYRGAAAVFHGDPQLSVFLGELADNEESHCELMIKLAELLRTIPAQPPSDIKLDQATRDRITAPLEEFSQRLAAASISEKEVMEYIARAEFSEWNDIFLYVVNTFGGRTREIQSMTAAVQDHEARIEHFFQTLPDELRPSLDVSTLPRVWERKVLVVEDSKLLRELTAGLLEKQASVDTAENGQDALEKTRESFFDAIVTDIRMPVLDGIGFYRRAVQEHPDMKNRFLFISFMPPPDAKTFISENNLSLLLKPFDPDDLRQAVAAITGGHSRGT